MTRAQHQAKPPAHQKPGPGHLLVPAKSAVSSGREWLLFWGLLVLYLALRLPALLNVPLFNDEAIYILRAIRFPADLPDTLGDGKLLQELLLALLMRLPGDPLIYSRLLSVICGIGTLVSLFFCGRLLSRPTVGLLAGLLFIGAPVAELHDRLGLPDSMLTCFACLILLASIRFTQHDHPTRMHAIALGGLIGLAGLVKFSGLLLLPIPILALLLLSTNWKQQLSFLPSIAIGALVLVALLAPFHYGGNERHKADFTDIGERLAIMAQNGALLVTWVVSYLPLPLLLPPILSIALHWRTPDASWRRLVFLLGAALSLPLIFFLLGNTLYPRYIMPAWPLLVLASAEGISGVWSLRWARTLSIAALGIALVWDGFFAVQLLREPSQAPMVAIDRRQYLETWTSGAAMPDLLATIRQEAMAPPGIMLVHNDQTRLVHLFAQIYLRDDPLIHQLSLDITQPNTPAQVQQLARETPTYILLDDEEYVVYDFASRFPNTRLVRRVENPLGTMSFYLYEQLPMPIPQVPVVEKGAPHILHAVSLPIVAHMTGNRYAR